MTKAIKYIYKEQYGKRKDLEKHFTDELGLTKEQAEAFIDELALLGYIANGSKIPTIEDKKYIRTWRMTKKADEYYNLFIKKITFFEKMEGFFLHAMGC